MPPYDPYVLKANALSFSGLNVQLEEGELTAFKDTDKFKMNAYGFSVDNGVTNMSWDHVRIASGHATDFQAVIPAVEGNAQATTLQINNKIAFNMSGSYAYMNKDEVHIFDNNVSDTASYGTRLVLENASSHTLDIGTDGISFSPGYSTKISWPDILSAGLPFADSWLFAVNDNASYNTSTLVLNNTLNINDGTTDNVINITTVSEPSITLNQPGTSTSALSSVLNNTNLTFTDANTDGEYNNGLSVLNTTSLSLGHTPAVGSSNDIAINSVDATVYIATDNNGEINHVNIAADGLTDSFTSADNFTLSTGIFNKTTLSRLSIFNDGSDPLTAVSDSFEITSVNSNMTFSLIESNPISNDSSALNSYQQVSKNSDGVYKSTLDLTAFNASTSVTNSITLTAIDSANSIATPVIKLDVTGTTTSKPSGYFSTGELNLTDLNADGSYNNSKTTVLSNNLSIARSTDGVNSKTIAMNNTSGYATSFSINEFETNSDYKIVTIDTGVINFAQNLSSLHQTNYANISPSVINSTSNFNDATNHSVVKTLSYANNTSTNSLVLNHSNPVTNDGASFTASQRVSVGGDDVYKSALDLTSFNSSTSVTNSITLSAIDTANSIATPVIKLDVTGTSASKPSGYFSTGELNLTDLNAAGSYNNSKTTVLSNNLSITRTTDGVNSKAIAMNNTSGYATSFSIIEIETNSDSKIVTVDTGLINMGHVLTSLHQTNYANMSPSVINSMFVFDDSTTNSVSKSLSYTNNTSTNSFTLQGSNPFTENSATFTSTQRVSVGNDGGYNSAATVQYYNASTNTTKSISLTAVDSNNSIVDPVIKVNDGAITSSLKSQSLSSTGDLSLSVVSGNELVLDVPSGADLKIGAGATSQTADGGFTGLWMRIKIGESYYKIPLMSDLSIQDNSSTINSFILDQLSKNVNALSVSDTYTLLLGKAVISYTGDREYWGPPQDTVTTYVSLNNTSYLKLTSFDYVGWDFNSINFTNAGALVGKIYIALWTDIVLTIRFNVVNTDIISGGNATEYKTTITTNNGSWTYVEVNLADFVFVKGDSASTKATVFSNIKQFLFATDTNVSNPVYIQYVALKRSV